MRDKAGKTRTHLLTAVEIQKLYDYASKHCGSNIWVEFTPSGLGNIVKIYKQDFFKGYTPVKIEITDIDSW